MWGRREKVSGFRNTTKQLLVNSRTLPSLSSSSSSSSHWSLHQNTGQPNVWELCLFMPLRCLNSGIDVTIAWCLSLLSCFVCLSGDPVSRKRYLHLCSTCSSANVGHTYTHNLCLIAVERRRAAPDRARPAQFALDQSKLACVI